MDSVSKHEIIGDANNTKGAYYHLVYALWRLLHEPARLSFYEGNDLLDRPLQSKVAPNFDGAATDDDAPLVPLLAREGSRDVWIQVKSTSKTWTLRRVLEDKSLLLNFILNALRSEQDNREAQFQLITQAKVDLTQGWTEFLENPESPKQVRPKQQLEEIVEIAARRMEKAGLPYSRSTMAVLHEKALGIVRELSKTEPIYIKTLTADIIAALTEVSDGNERARRLANTILGAFLQGSGTGVGGDDLYDGAWLDKVSGLPISKRRLFDRSPFAAVADASRQAVPQHWEEGRLAVRRLGLETALQQFLDSNYALFVLVGGSNIGKTWSVTRWTLDAPAKSMRLLIPGSDLDHLQSNNALAYLVRHRLDDYLSHQQWSDEQVLKKLRTANHVEAEAPMVIVVDDVRPHGEDSSMFRRDLKRLLDGCKDIGAKLVLTASKPLWEYYNLGRDMADDLFRPELTRSYPVSQQEELKERREAGTRQERHSGLAEEKVSDGNAPPHQQSLLLDESNTGNIEPAYSYELGALSTDEMRAFISKWLLPPDARRASIYLTGSAFVPLRNPYLLREYLKDYARELQNDPGAVPVPPIVDNLLDRRLRQMCEEVYAKTPSNVAELDHAVNALIEEAWQIRLNRTNGLTTVQAESIFNEHLGSRGPRALALAQQHGLLTTKGGVQIAEPLIAARLYARLLVRTLREHGEKGNQDLEAVIGVLHPAEHSDVAIAFLRMSATTRDSAYDPVETASTLLKLDRQWLWPVVEGLGQGLPDDYKTLAFLTSLTRGRKGSLVGFEACDVLGELAVRGRRAWKWTVGMYISERPLERRRGERALGIMVQYDAARMEAAARLRLQKAKRFSGWTFAERDERDLWLLGALDPLLNINSYEAAKRGQRVVRLYEQRLAKDIPRIHASLLDELDQARGQAAIGLGDVEVEDITRELSSKDVVTRFRAASALRPVAFVQPEKIWRPVFDAIAHEARDNVLNRLLWIVHRLRERHPEELLTAIETSRIVRWRKPTGAAGQTLGILGNLATLFPERVQSILPARLDAYPLWRQAFLSEILSYAWWCVAEHVPQARQQLEALTVPRLARVDDQFRIFGIRGAAIAQLGLMCLDFAQADELGDQVTPYLYSGMQYMHLDTGDFVARYAARIVQHPQYEKLQKLLLDCVHEEERVVSDIRRFVLYQGRFRCAQLCLEMLVSFVPYLFELRSLLDALPRGEQSLHTTYRLLIEEDNTDPQVIDAARQLCAEPSENTTHDMILEREICHYHLASHDGSPEAALEANSRIHRFLRDALQGATYLAHLAELHPDKTLSLLDSNVQDEYDLGFLYYLEEEAHSWQLLLIARVYARMYSHRPITCNEARELCQQMLTAVRNLPPSLLREEHEHIYDLIDRWLNDKQLEHEALPVPRALMEPETGEPSAIQRSHRTTRTLLERARNTLSQGEQINSSQLTEEIYSHAWWWESERTLDEGVFFFPAVRLALVAIGQQLGIPDPGAAFISDRIRANKLREEYRWAYSYARSDHPDPEHAKERLEEALKALESQSRLMPLDETLWLDRGYTLLLLQRPEEAVEVLRHCLALPWCRGNTLASAHYDLACAYSLMGRESECSMELEETLQVQPAFRQEISTESFLEAMRTKEWFSHLVNG